VERALLDEAITLVPSDSSWPDLAAEESARLRAALVDADIEHVGSTAVPGLDGKAIIDLLIGVRELAPSLRIPDYEALGEAGIAGRLYFRKRGPVSYNVQVVELGGPLWRDAHQHRD
jgi:GrpB-like predicted nucleotidyltransferase (UPF0157 family)